MFIFGSQASQTLFDSDKFVAGSEIVPDSPAFRPPCLVILRDTCSFGRVWTVSGVSVACLVSLLD